MRYEAAVLLNENQRRLIELHVKQASHSDQLELMQVDVGPHYQLRAYVRKSNHLMLCFQLKRKPDLEVVGDRYVTLYSNAIEPQVVIVSDSEYGGSVDVMICHMNDDPQMPSRKEIISPIKDSLGNSMLAYVQPLSGQRVKLCDGGHAYYLSHHVWGIPFEKRPEVVEASTKVRAAFYSENAKACMMVLEPEDNLALFVPQLIGLQRDLSRAFIYRNALSN